MHLSESTWTDADALETDLAVIPVGSTEQHGPHAPLGTDTIAAEAIADAGVEAYDGEVVRTPPISLTVSEEHRAFPGTLWVSEDTFRSYVREAIVSLIAHSWNQIVLVNGHGGNTHPLREVCADVSRHEEGYAVPFTWFDAVDPPEVSMGHAGPMETALLSYVDEDLIDEDRRQRAAAESADRWGEWVGSVNLAYDVDEFAPTGVVGDPTDGDDDLGERLFEEARDALVELLARVEDRSA